MPPPAGFLANLDWIEATPDWSWARIGLVLAELRFERGPCLWTTSSYALLSNDLRKWIDGVIFSKVLFPTYWFLPFLSFFFVFLSLHDTSQRIVYEYEWKGEIKVKTFGRADANSWRYERSDLDSMTSEVDMLASYFLFFHHFFPHFDIIIFIFSLFFSFYIINF